MFGSALYALTAMAAFASYGILDLFLSEAAFHALPAVRGAFLLFAAAVLHFWKPRPAAAIALFSAVLIWPVLWFFLLSSFWIPLTGWLGIIALPLIGIIALLLAPTTLYAAIVVTGLSKHIRSPAWVFPQARAIPQAAIPATPRPSSLRMAEAILYIWWGLAAAEFLFRFRATLLKGSFLSDGFSVWFFEITPLVGILWVIAEILSGKNWARLALVLFFLLRLLGFLNFVVLSAGNRGIEFTVLLLALAAQAVAMVLVFNKASAPYFRST